MPRAGVITFVGTLGIAALPPLNGFVSEWLIFQGLFQGFRTHSHLVAILIVVAAATFGLTGGLAIYAFVRGYGIPFLGMPRTDRPAEADRDEISRSPGPALLAVACVALAVGAPVVLVGLARAIRTATGVALRPILLPGKLTVIPAHTDFSGFSPTYLTVFLLAVAARPGPDLPGRPAARRVCGRAGLGRRDARLQAAHAVLGDDLLRADQGDIRRALPAVCVGAARL